MKGSVLVVLATLGVVSSYPLDFSNTAVIEEHTYGAIVFTYFQFKFMLDYYGRKGPLSYFSARDLERMERECNLHGSSETFENLKVGVTDAFKCFQSEFNFFRMPENKDLSATLGKICRVSPQLMTCYDKFLTAVRPCIDPETRLSFDKQVKVGPALIDYLCYEDGQRIMKFITKGGSQCMSEKKTELNECGRPTEFKDEEEKRVGYMSKKYEEYYCTNIGGIRSCVKSTLGKCRTTVAADFVDGLISAVNVMCD